MLKKYKLKDGKIFYLRVEDGSWIISDPLPPSVEKKLSTFFQDKRSSQYAGVRTFVINTTNDCNLRCEYCYVHRHSCEYLEFKEGKDILEHICLISKNSGETRVEICFHGSEPLMNFGTLKDLIKMKPKFEEKYKIDIYFSLQTNATLLDESKLHFLKKYNVGIGISLDGFEEVHNLTRKYLGGGGSFKEVWKAIKLAKKILGEVGILTVISNYNIAKLPLIYDFYVNSPYIDQFRMLLVHPSKEDRNKIPDYIPSIEDVMKFYFPLFVKELDNYISKGIVRMDNIEHRILNFFTKKVYPVCGRCANCEYQPDVFIDLNGNMGECDNVRSSKFSKKSIFDFNNIYEIVNNEDNFRNSFKLIPESCRECPLLYICGSACPSQVIGNKQYYCRLYKKEYLAVIERLLKISKIVNA